MVIVKATCHWCHVMERESFEDPQVAWLLNRDFVAVKVDREERPDVDAVYMSVCQALTGQGGWPLTIVMTPEQKPFYAATYLPRQSRYGIPGMLELLPELARQWRENRPRLLQAGEEISGLLRRQSEAAAQPRTPSREDLQQAADLFAQSFDTENGGFGAAPKFPTPHNLLFLLRYSALEDDANARAMVEKTLEQMARGGIFDHIGGGFSRYSTDERWLVPHFEKMLYDNALLAYVYLEAYQLTRRAFYKTVAERTLDYVLRELTHPEGGFFCGQDADSDGVEGKYYVFTPGELEGLLGKQDAAIFCRWFGIAAPGNFEGKSIPNLLHNDRFDQPDDDIPRLCEAVYAYRSGRVALHKDDKILTSWNALMLSAFAKAGRVLGEERYSQAAQKCRRFLRENLRDGQGRLLVRWREGDAAIHGKIDDYAFYAWALLELYQAGYDPGCLTEAAEVTGQMLERFSDGRTGGFYLYAADSEQLISRPKELYDGALPSGNSVAALVLDTLFRLTGEPKWREYADRQTAFMSPDIHRYPPGYSFALCALLGMLYPSGELVCATGRPEPDPALEQLLRGMYRPNLTVVVKTPGNAEALTAAAPYTRDYPIPEIRAAYYLCQNGVCKPPVYDLQELAL